MSDIEPKGRIDYVIVYDILHLQSMCGIRDLVVARVRDCHNL